MSTATLYNWSDVENEQLNPLLTRQFVTGEQSMFARIVLKKGCVVPRHSHPNEQITFITEGALRFDFDDGTSHTVHAGEVLVIPGNLPTPPPPSKTASTSTSSPHPARTGSTKTTATSENRD